MPQYFAVKLDEDGFFVRPTEFRVVPDFTDTLRPVTTINDVARTFRRQGWMLLEAVEPSPEHAHTMRPEEV